MGLSTVEMIAGLFVAAQAGVWSGITIEARRTGRPVLDVAGDLFVDLASVVRRPPDVNVAIINYLPEEDERPDWDVEGEFTVFGQPPSSPTPNSTSRRLLELSQRGDDIRSLGVDI